jgi:peroxiredoxin
MTTTVYNSITIALEAAAVVALCVALYSFVFMLLRWKTPERRRHMIRLLAAIGAIPCLIGIQQAVLWLVFLPALDRQQMAEINAARAKRQAETSVVQVGDTAPRFSLVTVDGAEFSLPADGNVVLINFFATWCGPCQLELPHIEQIWTGNKDHRRFRLLVIGREETTETVRQHREKSGFSFPIAADPDRTVYSLFARESIPRTVIVAPDGRIVYSQVGFMEEDLDELHSALQEQLARVRKDSKE